MSILTILHSTSGMVLQSYNSLLEPLLPLVRTCLYAVSSTVLQLVSKVGVHWVSILVVKEVL